MRKLKLVSRKTLLYRANSNEGKCFFNTVRNALVTSIKGSFAEAHRMSGGDYDGDRAWNANLLDCLPDNDAFVAEVTTELRTKPSDLENKLMKDCSLNDILDYMIHFRNHHRILGSLSEQLDYYIDKHGFESVYTKNIGYAAYLQVRILISSFSTPSPISKPFLIY